MKGMLPTSRILYHLKARADLLKEVTCFSHQSSHFFYLRALAIQGSGKIDLLEELVDKASSKVDGWANEMLSKRGKFTLTNQVLSSIPIYLLYAYTIPKDIWERLEARYSSFLRDYKKGNNNRGIWN